MNFNINKYQAGGLVTVQPLPLTPQPQQQQYQQSSQEDTTEKKEKSAIGDSLLKELIGKGVTTDVMELKRDLDSAKIEYNRLSEPEKQSAPGRRLREFISGNDFSRINKILRSAEQFKLGIENVKSNNAYDEFAITSNRMFVKNIQTGEIKQMSAEEYAGRSGEEPDGAWAPITNSELINEREINRTLANNSDVFIALNNSKGISGVRKEVDDFLSNLGSNVQSSTTNQLVKGTSNQLLNAVQEIKNQVQEGVFDVKQIMKSSSNEQQLQAVLEEAYEMLSPSAKQLLKTKAATKGVAPDKINDAVKNYIALMLAGKSSQSIERTFDAQYNKELTAELSGGAKAGEDKGTTAKGYLETLVGLNMPMQTIDINIGSNTSLKAPASIAGTYRQNNQATGPMTVSDMKDLLSVIDQNSITVGDAHVDKSKLGSVMYQGSTLSNVQLPITKDDKGNEIPDYKMANRMDAATNEIKSLRYKDVNIIKSIYRSHGIDTNEQGKPTYPVGQFILMEVLADEDAINNRKDNSLYEKVTDSTQTALFNQKYEYGNLPATKANKRDVPGRWHVLGGKNDLYSTQIALRVRDTGPNARFADKQVIIAPKSQATAQFYRETGPIWNKTVTEGQKPVKLNNSFNLLNQ